MKIHFGTDGIRGRANENLSADMALKIGSFLGSRNPKGKVLIGRDTRLSGGMFSMALSCGLTSHGCDAYLLDICSTPALIYLTAQGKFSYGIMITASHNPYTDNGIKIISSSGTKIDAQLEAELEAYIYGDEVLPAATGDQIGCVYDYSDYLNTYLDHLCHEFPDDLSRFRIAIDCANGSSVVSARRVLERLGAKVDAIADQPDGMNINRDCGSTHIQYLSQKVAQGDYDCGFAFDGDADRLIAVAKDGQVIDGDKILYCYGKYLHKNGKLAGGKLVTTVMANLGLFRKLDELHIGYEKTAVGDKYVYECMAKNGYVLGGEQSGHIIFANYATTGDGLLSALALLKMMIDENQSLNELTDDLFIYPQVLKNIEVKDKEKMMKDDIVKAKCDEVEKELQGNGRVLVRCSGTEPLVRVMIEAQTIELCNQYADEIIDVIEARNV